MFEFGLKFLDYAFDPHLTAPCSGSSTRGIEPSEVFETLSHGLDSDGNECFSIGWLSNAQFEWGRLHGACGAL